MAAVNPRWEWKVVAMASKLAIHGGERVVPEGRVRPWPEVTEADRDAVVEVLRDGDMGRQREVQSKGLAEEWARYMGVAYAIPCNSGTAALHMGVAGVGVEPAVLVHETVRDLRAGRDIVLETAVGRLKRRLQGSSRGHRTADGSAP